MCRPRSAPTRPRLCRDAGSSVGASSTGCWAGQCAGAIGRHKAVLERYAALRCLWHGVRVVERSKPIRVQIRNVIPKQYSGGPVTGGQNAHPKSQLGRFAAVMWDQNRSTKIRFGRCVAESNAGAQNGLAKIRYTPPAADNNRPYLPLDTPSLPQASDSLNQPHPTSRGRRDVASSSSSPSSEIDTSNADPWTGESAPAGARLWSRAGALGSCAAVRSQASRRLHIGSKTSRRGGRHNPPRAPPPGATA